MRLLVTLIFLFLCLPLALAATTYQGQVVGVQDGDTLTVLTPARQQIKVRLAEIDTPESAQPYGSRAKQVLSELAFGKQARVVVIDTDRYGRTVGRVYVDGVDVNAELVRQGAAWVYRQYAKDKALFALEAEAKAAKRGLWSLPEAQRTPPWEWRRVKRSGGSISRPQPLPVTGRFTCGAKRTCGEMTSCAEARFYLEQCGLTRLDGNRDGTPCEALCR